MKGIEISLVDSMGSDLSVVNAARVSFDKVSEEFDGKDEKLVQYLAKHKHMTPFRHNAIQIRCKAPIFIARQLGKHQAGLSWNEVSRRYVDSEPDFFVPEAWRKRPGKSIKQGSTGVVQPQNIHRLAYHENMEASIIYYNKLLEAGVAPEMARMVLPQSMLTEWYWTGNLLSFMHVYNERVEEGAQLEAQAFGHELGAILKELFPVSFEALRSDR